jgi:hypothetical protein
VDLMSHVSLVGHFQFRTWLNVGLRDGDHRAGQALEAGWD